MLWKLCWRTTSNSFIKCSYCHYSVTHIQSVFFYAFMIRWRLQISNKRHERKINKLLFFSIEHKKCPIDLKIFVTFFEFNAETTHFSAASESEQYRVPGGITIFNDYQIQYLKSSGGWVAQGTTPLNSSVFEF